MVEQVDDFVSLVKAKQVTFDLRTTLFFLAGGLNDTRLPEGEVVANLEREIRKRTPPRLRVATPDDQFRKARVGR